MPIQSDLRYNWLRVWLAAIDQSEMRELVVDAWRMVVPKRVAAEYLTRLRLGLDDHPHRRSRDVGRLGHSASPLSGVGAT